MKLLKDDELVALVENKDPIIVGLEKLDNWYSKKSPIQPSSIDLHIGKIWVPETEDGKPGSSKNPKTDQHSLRVGGTAVVTTSEEVNLPDNIAAFGFPPSTVSSRGILMTNPGHVDPGWKGPLQFTVINMGKESYSLVVGSPIVTLLLVQLSGNAHAGYAARGNSNKSDAPRSLDDLAVDFLSVEKRAQEVANRAYRNLGIIGIVITVVGSLIVAIVNSWVNAPIKEVQKDMEVLRRQLDVTEKFSDFDRRIKSLETTKSAAPTTKPRNTAAPAVSSSAKDPGK